MTGPGKARSAVEQPQIPYRRVKGGYKVIASLARVSLDAAKKGLRVWPDIPISRAQHDFSNVKRFVLCPLCPIFSIDDYRRNERIFLYLLTRLKLIPAVEKSMPRT